MKKEHLYIIIAGILSGGIVFSTAFLAKMGLSLYQISVFGFIFSCIFLAPYVVYKKDFLQNKGELKHFALFGLIGVPLVLTEFAPVVLGVPVALSVLLLYTQPIWNILMSHMYLKEKITKTKVLALVVAMVGIVTLINPFTIGHIGNIWGIAAGLFSGIVFAGWIMFGRISGEKNVKPVTTQFYQAAFALVFLLVAYPFLAMVIRDPKLITLSFNIPWFAWIYLAVFEILFYIIAHIFLFEGQKKVSASTSGMILLLEPVSAAILALIFLGQHITFNIIIGGIFISLANYLVIRGEPRIQEVSASL